MAHQTPALLPPLGPPSILLLSLLPQGPSCSELVCFQAFCGLPGLSPSLPPGQCCLSVQCLWDVHSTLCPAGVGGFSPGARAACTAPSWHLVLQGVGALVADLFASMNSRKAGTVFVFLTTELQSLAHRDAQRD